MSVMARVAGAISAYELVFDAGSAAGVEVNNLAEVYREHSINEVGSQKLLGTVRRTLVRVRIIEVQEFLSVGETYEDAPFPDEPFSSALGTYSTSALGLKLMGATSRRIRVAIAGGQGSTDWPAVGVSIGDKVEIKPGPSKQVVTK
jgi:hypothetical protein